MRWGFYILTRNYARSPHGTRVCDLKQFYQGARITASGALSIKKVMTLIMMNDLMDGKEFEVFIENFLFP